MNAHHPRHGGRDRARRHDDQSEVPHRRRQDPHATTSSSPTRCGTSRSRRTSSPTIRSTASAPPGGVTTGKGDWAWLQHTLACLNDHGRAAVVLDTGAVTRGSGSKNEDKERNIRKWFVDRDLIDGVILLPDNLFYNTTAAGVIVVLNKRKPAARKDKIVLLNASRRFKKGTAEELPARGRHPAAGGGVPQGRAGRGRDRRHHPAAGRGGGLQPEPEPVGRRRATTPSTRPIKDIVADLLTLDDAGARNRRVACEDAGARYDERCLDTGGRSASCSKSAPVRPCRPLRERREQGAVPAHVERAAGTRSI